MRIQQKHKPGAAPENRLIQSAPKSHKSMLQPTGRRATHDSTHADKRCGVWCVAYDRASSANGNVFRHQHEPRIQPNVCGGVSCAQTYTHTNGSHVATYTYQHTTRKIAHRQVTYFFGYLQRAEPVLDSTPDNPTKLLISVR